jgi:hypothetical protein
MIGIWTLHLVVKGTAFTGSPKLFQLPYNNNYDGASWPLQVFIEQITEFKTKLNTGICILLENGYNIIKYWISLDEKFEDTGVVVIRICNLKKDRQLIY